MVQGEMQPRVGPGRPRLGPRPTHAAGGNAQGVASPTEPSKQWYAWCHACQALRARWLAMSRGGPSRSMSANAAQLGGARKSSVSVTNALSNVFCSRTRRKKLFELSCFGVSWAYQCLRNKWLQQYACSAGSSRLLLKLSLLRAGTQDQTGAARARRAR